jgi:hypothetical protein
LFFLPFSYRRCGEEGVKSERERKNKFREDEDLPREVFWGEASDGGSFPAVRRYGSKGAKHYTDYGSLPAFQHFCEVAQRDGSDQ